MKLISPSSKVTAICFVLSLYVVLITNSIVLAMSEPTLPRPGIIGVALHLTAKRIGDPAGLFIRATHPMGPAIKAGLTHGQEILAVDGMSIRGKTYREVVAMIRGEIGKSVILQVKTFSGFKEVKIVRVSEQMLSKEKQI